MPFSGEDLVKNAHLFQNDLNLEKGDEVMVVGGELQGAKAVVERVSGRNVTLRTGKKRETVVEDRMEHLCKLFHDGKRVDVVSGSHQGKSGVVLSQQGFNVDIWTDNFHTITVNASNLARHRSDRTFRNDLGIKRNDLIRTAQGTLGVVLEVKKDSVSILMSTTKWILSTTWTTITESTPTTWLLRTLTVGHSSQSVSFASTRAPMK